MTPLLPHRARLICLCTVIRPPLHPLQVFMANGIMARRILPPPARTVIAHRHSTRHRQPTVTLMRAVDSNIRHHRVESSSTVIILCLPPLLPVCMVNGTTVKRIRAPPAAHHRRRQPHRMITQTPVADSSGTVKREKAETISQDHHHRLETSYTAIIPSHRPPLPVSTVNGTIVKRGRVLVPHPSLTAAVAVPEQTHGLCLRRRRLRQINMSPHLFHPLPRRDTSSYTGIRHPLRHPLPAYTVDGIMAKRIRAPLVPFSLFLLLP